ncbi:conserved hypothetical protein [Haloferula helveola]|uniref:Lipoprotein n=1 Tax=Haloferula helveola TaxID=490095 RepID=A0ABM7RCN2_9BACT|nr:conserved hypothetical protein [Haloferula helveola]
MTSRKIITSALALLLLLPVASCQQKQPAGNGAAAKPLPGDVDLGHGYVKRDGAIHFIGGGTTGTGANATRIDMPSPELLKKVVDSQYGPFTTAEGLDVESFEALSEEYTRDEKRVYFKVVSTGEFLVILLEDADPGSFDVLGRNLARDKDHVWYLETIQQGADPASVELIDGDQVFKDKDSVHYAYDIIAGADPATFRHLSSGYYADKNRAYWGPTPIADADPVTFKVLGGSFIATDKTNAYRSGELMKGFDVASLELILHNPYGYQILSDKNGIHMNMMKFPRSKPGTVKVIDDGMVKSDDLVFLADTYHSVPVTVFKEDGKLMAETYSYDPASRELQCLITAEVTPKGLENVRTGPLPGKTEVPAVPDWRIPVFERPDLVERMIEAGKHLK